MTSTLPFTQLHTQPVARKLSILFCLMTQWVMSIVLNILNLFISKVPNAVKRPYRVCVKVLGGFIKTGLSVEYVFIRPPRSVY